MIVILDVDGTLVKDLDSDKLLPVALENCRKLREQGHTLVLASNQGGVMLGFRSLESTLLRITLIAQQIGAVDFQICTWHPYGKVKLQTGHHPELHYSDSDTWRKPAAGMLQYYMQKFPNEQYMYVGDRRDDLLAARDAGITFVWNVDWKV